MSLIIIILLFLILLVLLLIYLRCCAQQRLPSIQVVNNSGTLLYMVRTDSAVKKASITEALGPVCQAH